MAFSECVRLGYGPVCVDSAQILKINSNNKENKTKNIHKAKCTCIEMNSIVMVFRLSFSISAFMPFYAANLAAYRFQ